jgi:aryl-alcohol dehydrogenase-like predicted oxidoreductase
MIVVFLPSLAWAEKAGFNSLGISLEQKWNVIDEVRSIAKELNVSVGAVALRWLMQRNGVTSTIIGPRTMEQFDQNMQAVNINLSDEQMARLTKVSDTPLPYPFDIIQKIKQMDNL